MTSFEHLKIKILKYGYRIEKIDYVETISHSKPVISIYEVNKPYNEQGKTGKYIACEIAHNIAKMLSDETGSKIIIGDRRTVALNFKPVPVPHNHIRTS